MQVVAAMNSSVSINRNFWIDPKSGNQYFVAVQYPEDPTSRSRTCRTSSPPGRTRRARPAQQPGRHPLQRPQPVEFNHVSLRRVVDVLVNTEDRDIGGVAADISKRLQGTARCRRG